MSITVSDYVVTESVRESRQGFKIHDHFSVYYEAYKAFRKRFRARYCDILIDNNIELE